jgi:predicted AAA+ superfamily ATPase
MKIEMIKQILVDQKEAFNLNRSLIERDLDLTSYINTKQVVVISGVRRCGKSSLLYLMKSKLHLDESEYCYVNFDDERLVNDTSILDEIYKIHVEVYQKEPVFFFDEIQNVPKWEKFVNRMYEKGLKIIVTGSNASLLSSEIASSLTGRNKTITLFPFSFNEYLKFRNKKYQLESLTSKQKSLLQGDLHEYMEFGGFPLVVKEKDLEIINSFFQDILYRDIIARYRIIQVYEIKQIALYLYANVGKLFSYSTLQTISGVKSSSSIKNYIDYFEQSYLFSYLKKFDYSVKKQLLNSRKVYAIDPGVCNRMGFRFSENKGRVLENVIYLQLLRVRKEVFYHSEKKECDFLVQEGLKISEAIQVVYELSDDNAQREMEGLLEAMRIYNLKSGIIVYVHNDMKNTVIPNEITLIPAWQWLLSKIEDGES